MQAAKRQMEAGFFGRIYAARTVWQRRSGIPGYGSWFTNRELAGGGVLLDLGVHTLDRALYLMGYPRAATVSGAAFAELGPQGLGLGGWGAEISAPAAGARYDVDDLAWAFIRLTNGAVIQFQAAWASHLPEAMVTEILGTAGGAQIGMREQLELYTLLNHDEATIKVPLHEAKVSSYLQLIENFVRYLDGDAHADIVTQEQALVSAEILDAMVRSAESGREVALRPSNN
jgi:predicted dehydrogenase